MLVLYHGGVEHPIDNTEYYVRELANGLDEVIFDISIYDPIYALIAEQDNIVDRAGQKYLVKQIDAGASTAKIICQLDVDDWRAAMRVNYDSGSKTVAQQINAVKPTGWTVSDQSGISISRTLHGDYTPLDICQVCTETYSVYIRWDNKTKTCTILPKAMSAPIGAFATRELNLKEINYKGKSNNFATRLFAYGKDGLSFNNKMIHGQMYTHPYVDNRTYSNRVIAAYWQDDRYTDPESLYDDAVTKLAALAAPERSYDCAIVDLQATNPELYNNLDFSLFTTATLIDDVKETAVNYQVVERHVWPYHPEKNEVIFDSAPTKITQSVIQLQDAVNNPSSTFQQIWDARVKTATDWLTNGDGYVVAVQDQNGNWKETLYMDTPDIATAQKVLRMNVNGIGFSSNGVNGPYTSAWTLDGVFNADFILTGTLDADTVRVLGKIEATSGYIGSGTNDGWNIGNKSIYNKCTSTSDSAHAGTYIGTDGIRNQGSAAGDYTTIIGGKITSTDADLKGKIQATSGYIGQNTGNGWNIANKGIYNGCTGMSDSSHEGIYVGTDGIRLNASPTASTPLAYTKITKLGIETETGVTAKGVFANTISATKGISLATDNSGYNGVQMDGPNHRLIVSGAGSVGTGAPSLIVADGLNDRLDLYDTAGNDNIMLIGSSGTVAAKSYQALENGLAYSGASGSITWTVGGTTHSLTVKQGIVVAIS